MHSKLSLAINLDPHSACCKKIRDKMFVPNSHHLW